MNTSILLLKLRFVILKLTGLKAFEEMIRVPSAASVNLSRVKIGKTCGFYAIIEPYP